MREAHTVDTALLEAVVQDFQTLAGRYRQAGLLTGSPVEPTVRRLLGASDEVLGFRRLFLLSDGLLRNVVGELLRAHRPQPTHVTVFGGTQVGKSTCVNVLLGTPAARVYHTAGFTRHAQGFLPPEMPVDTVNEGNPWGS